MGAIMALLILGRRR